MKYLLVLVFLISGCGYWPPWDKPKSNPAPSNGPTADQLSQLQDIYSSTQPWAETYFDDGDTALYAGISCLAGEATQCDVVQQSLGSNGEPYRAPDQKDITSNSSSRDMLLGYLAYIVATKDQATATALVNYIHANGNMLCNDASDNRCDVTLPVYSEVWGTMGKIWSYIGLPPDSTMNEGSFGESEILAGESEFSPAGYTQHLPMVEMWIRQHVGGWDGALSSAAASVASSQNLNPFYEYVAHGATQQAAALTITECGGAEPAQKLYWTWQEDDTLQRWTARSGYDCLSMIDLLTK
jgi:hypothetical protein